MFRVCQLKRRRTEASIMLTKSGGYKTDCQKVAELRIDLRPKRRYRTLGVARMKASTMAWWRPRRVSSAFI